MYNHLCKLSESEEGIFEKIIKESIQNLREQLERYNKIKLMLKPCVRVLVLWLSQERFYDPSLEEVTSLINDYFYDLEETKFWNRPEAEKFMADCEYENYLTMIKVNQQQVTLLMFCQPDEDSEEMDKIKRYFFILDFFFYASRWRKRSKIQVKEFHLDILCKEWSKSIPDFYLDWYKARRRMDMDDMELDDEDEKIYDLDKRKDKFLYMHFPWAFDASAKALMMKFE